MAISKELPTSFEQTPTVLTMDKPTLTDYVRLVYTLFDRFLQEQHHLQERGSGSGKKLGRSFTYGQEALIVFFVLMQFRRVSAFKAQKRWLEAHPEMHKMFRMKETVPCRSTLSRRHKALYPTVQAFVAFIGRFGAALEDEAFSSRHLVEDKSLFKAKGPVWHQSDRKAGRIPKGLRGLDTDATWSKSAYQGWVYGYGVHVTCTEDAFPKLVGVETASVSESAIAERKEETILASGVDPLWWTYLHLNPSPTRRSPICREHDLRIRSSFVIASPEDSPVPGAQ